MIDPREPPLNPPPPDLPDPDDPAVFVDKPERETATGHLTFVAVALFLMVIAWWGF